jgi:hypothetical protein
MGLRVSDQAQPLGGPARPGRAILAAMAGVVMLCWPALINGGAFFFPDTSTYLRSADMIVGELTGWESEWSDRRTLYVEDKPAERAATPSTAAAGPAPAAAAGPVHPVLLGRSIYYGLAVFPFVALFGSLGAAFLQGAFAVLTIWLTLAAFGSERRRMPARLLLATALLAGLTSLPFFVSMLMPDVFAGFAVALAVSAAAGWQRLARWERAGLALLLVFSGMAHSSHVLVLLALAGVTMLVMLFTRVKVGTAAGLMVLAAASGIAGEQLFIQAVTHRLGEPPVRPPFLTARLINDGPGYRLLRESCPSVGLVACRYLDRMPRDSDAFLWSYKPQEGVFSTEPIAVQRELAKQDMRFAVATLGYDPFGVIGSSLRSVARQVTLTDLNLFNAASVMGEGLSSSVPASVAAEIRASRFGRNSMPVELSRWLNLVSACIAALFLAAVVAGRTGERRLARTRAAAGLLLAAVALNASVTGAMSKPHDRYNVRVLWVLQLAALAILVTRSDRKHLEQK